MSTFERYAEKARRAMQLKQRGLSADKLRLHIKTLPQPKEAHKPPWESRESRAEVELIRNVGELVSGGKGQKALQLLDDFLTEPGTGPQTHDAPDGPLCDNHSFAYRGSQHSATLL
jgi:hypothetical protein